MPPPPPPGPRPAAAMMGRLNSMMASLQASMLQTSQQPTVKYIKTKEEEEESVSPWLVATALGGVVIISMYVGAKILQR